MSSKEYNFLIIVFGRLLQIIIMVLAIKVQTYLLKAEELGYIYIFTSLYTFFILFLISPFGIYFNRQVTLWHNDGMLKNILYKYILYIIFISFVSSILGFVLYGQGVANSIDKNIFIILLFLFIIFMSLNQMILYILNILYFRLSFIILTILTAFFILVFGYVFVHFLGSHAKNWLYGIVLSNAIFMVLGLIILISKQKNIEQKIVKLEKVKIKNVVKFTFPLSIATLFIWLQSNGYRFIIEQKISLEFLGYFGVGLALAAQISGAFESVLLQYLHPKFYNLLANSSKQQRQNAINFLINKTLYVYLTLAFFITFLAKYITFVFIDEKFFSTYIFVVFGAWIEFFRMSTNILGHVSQSEIKTKNFSFVYILSSLITLMLVYFFSTSKYYEWYLPLSLLLGGLIGMIFMYFFMKRLIDFKIKYKLLLYACIFCIPYFGIYFIKFENNIYQNLMILFVFGLYFLLSLYLINKKGISYGYS